MRHSHPAIEMSIHSAMAAFATPSPLVLHQRTTLARPLTRQCVVARVAAPPPKPSSRTKIAAPTLPFSGVTPKSAANLVVEGDFLESTLLQKLQVYGFFALAATEFSLLLARGHVLEQVLGALVGYLFADLATGVYHWAVDNYGSGETPVLGRQIAAFQGHHGAPWTIAQRAFANNLSALTVPVTPQMVALLGLSSHLSVGFASFYATSLLFIVLSQEAHRQAHFIRPSPLFERLQKWGLSLPRRMHAQHHAEPYGVNYCIVSGVWNALLDRQKVFRRLEKIVFEITGNEPIAWKLDPELKRDALRL